MVKTKSYIEGVTAELINHIEDQGVRFMFRDDLQSLFDAYVTPEADGRFKIAFPPDANARMTDEEKERVKLAWVALYRAMGVPPRKGS